MYNFDNDDYFEVFLAQSVPNFNFVRHQQQVSCQQIQGVSKKRYFLGT